jgi:thiamine-monophosphate kinase
MKSLRDMGENKVVQRLLAQLAPPPPDLFTGPGDDCAVVPFSASQWQLLKTDAIVEGVHFLSDENFERVGWKAIARVISDFAAMGGNARWFLVTLAVSPDTNINQLESLYRGMSRCVLHFGAHIVGGETTSIAAASGMVISIAATGFVKKSHLTLRSTARCGDEIFVTGRLGGSLAGRHLEIRPRVKEAHWLCKLGYASAMMDLSDGLAKDLPRMAQASKTGFWIDLSALPCHPGCTSEQALRDGEDYELLFTTPAESGDSLIKRWQRHFPETPLTCIGRMVDKKKSMSMNGGWDHFACGK